MLCSQSLFNRMVPGMDVCELFCPAEGFIAPLHINDTEREPHALTTLMSHKKNSRRWRMEIEISKNSVLTCVQSIGQHTMTVLELSVTILEGSA